MVLLRLTPLALSRSRFAVSPLAETLGSAIVLAKEQPAKPWLADWHAANRPAFTARTAADPFAAGLLALLSSTKWIPAFASPPPEGMHTTLDAELAVVAAASDAAVHAGLRRAREASWRSHDLAWLTGRSLGPRVAAVLRLVWDGHVGPEWPRRKTVLQRDIAHRTGLLASTGWPGALHRMSRRSGWVGADAIRFSDQCAPDRVVGADGMRFVPISIASGSWLCEAPPDRHALVYPARGPAAEPAPPPGGLDRLLGANRTAILTALAHPATSTELAARLGLALGTVGGHLTVLREADLVHRARVGRRVVYRRTATGDRLTDPR